MSRKSLSPFQAIWAKWKALPLPWRKEVFAGIDLKGNTYWEFPDARGMGPGRMRRIVKYPKGTHISEVKVPPMWHQWLRHQRGEPPSVREQQAEEARQARIKILAAEADARWEAKPRIAADTTQASLQRPEKKPNLRGPSRYAQVGASPARSASASRRAEEPAASDSDPWKKEARLPNNGWQPKAWTPGAKPS